MIDHSGLDIRDVRMRARERFCIRTPWRPEQGGGRDVIGDLRWHGRGGSIDHSRALGVSAEHQAGVRQFAAMDWIWLLASLTPAAVLVSKSPLAG